MKNRLEHSVPEKEGVSSGLIVNFLNEIEKTGEELHGIMILVHNKVIFEAYNEPYRADIPHIMHSFTKCLTNMAVGLAYSEGYIDLDDPILKYFTQYEAGANEYLKEATIRNLITMRSGQERSIGGNEWRPLETSWLDAYFQVPFVRTPGSVYLYSSGNSYVLSAIVQKVTGKTCREYLREKITEKIGTTDFTWDLSPEGICSGGNGVKLTVDDMARIGLLFLNRGRWGEEQLLSEEWVDYAMGYKNPVERAEDEPEYNFHWEHEGDCWSAKGMFGQTCAVIPKLHMVVAYTAADQSDTISSVLQKELVSPIEGGKHEKISYEILRNKGLRMTLEGKNRSIQNHYIPENKTYKFQLNGSIDDIREVSMEFGEKEFRYQIRDQRGLHVVIAGMDHWIHGVTSMTGAYLHHQYEMDQVRISACAYWKDANTLMMEWRYPEMAFCDYVSISWEKQVVRINRWVNMNSQDLERPELVLVKD